MKAMALRSIRSLLQIHSYKKDDKGWNGALPLALDYVYFGAAY